MKFQCDPYKYLHSYKDLLGMAWALYTNIFDLIGAIGSV